MEARPRLLIVDDEEQLRNLFDRLFSRHNMDVTTCSNALLATEILEESEFDLVITDFMMPDMDGLELLSHVRENYPSMKVVMITAHANVQHAVRAMQTGAIDYIAKPFAVEVLVERVNAILAKQVETVEAPATKKTRKTSGSRKVRYIGDHPSIQRLQELIPKLSANTAPVFIQGESGTGKEVLSKLIHQSSNRSTGPFIAVNCANLPRDLVESHLFGHRKGAFTGAIDDMTGAFERASGGTLLLDEITEVELPVQAKLLRVLQEQEFIKVGSSEAQKSDVRVIATSNRNIDNAIQGGIFREDLYHRLAVFPITVPALRERISDVPALASHFVEKYCELYTLPKKKVVPELMNEFQTSSWPGNVRQLENMIQRGVLLSADRDTIDLEDVFNDFFVDSKATAAVTDEQKRHKLETIEEMERSMIFQALDETNNNQQMAAKRLGISARTIRNKLKKYREEGLLDEQ